MIVTIERFRRAVGNDSPIESRKWRESKKIIQLMQLDRTMQSRTSISVCASYLLSNSLSCLDDFVGRDFLERCAQNCYKTLALNANQVRFDNNSFVLRIGPGVEGIVRELSGKTYLSQEDDEEGK